MVTRMNRPISITITTSSRTDHTLTDVVYIPAVVIRGSSLMKEHLLHQFKHHTIEQAAILREIVEQANLLNPLDSASYSAYKYVKLIQELLGYVRDTCPDIHKPSEKLVVVTPIKKKKIVSSMFDARHDLGFLEFVSDVNASSKSKSVKKTKKKEEWKPTGKVFTKIGYNWRPTRRTFTLVGNTCPLTRITVTNKVPLWEPIPLEVVAQEYVIVQIVLWYLDSGYSKHMTRDRSQLTNFVHKFLANGYCTKGLKQSKTDKTEQENGKSMKIQSRRYLETKQFLAPLPGRCVSNIALKLED
ncbi:hypothetical protein Tco_0740014 [Tanacetum coccineum]